MAAGDANATESTAAEKTVIEIRDSLGTVVRTIELSGQAEGGHKFEWDGKDNSGNVQPEGRYTFNVSAQDPDGNSVAATPLIVGTITSIHYENGTATLRVGDFEIDLGDVVEIGLNTDAFAGGQDAE